MKEKQKTLSFNAQRLQRVLLSPEVSITIPLIALCIYTGIQNPAFFALKNIQIILRYCAFVGALAIGQSFVLMTGQIDLSIGTNSTFTSLCLLTARYISDGRRCCACLQRCWLARQSAF